LGALRALPAALDPAVRAGPAAPRWSRQPAGARRRGRPVRPRRRWQVQEPDLHQGSVTMATARPVRAMDPYAEQFWTFTLSRELRLQQCSACGKFRWPPGPTCDRGLPDAFAGCPTRGKATVLAWAAFPRGHLPAAPP